MSRDHQGLHQQVPATFAEAAAPRSLGQVSAVTSTLSSSRGSEVLASRDDLPCGASELARPQAPHAHIQSSPFPATFKWQEVALGLRFLTSGEDSDEECVKVAFVSSAKCQL